MLNTDTDLNNLREIEKLYIMRSS